jgi:hypothetical protein
MTTETRDRAAISVQPWSNAAARKRRSAVFSAPARSSGGNSKIISATRGIAHREGETVSTLRKRKARHRQAVRDHGARSHGSAYSSRGSLCSPPSAPGNHQCPWTGPHHGAVSADRSPRESNSRQQARPAPLGVLSISSAGVGEHHTTAHACGRGQRSLVVSSCGGGLHFLDPCHWTSHDSGLHTMKLPTR